MSYLSSPQTLTAAVVCSSSLFAIAGPVSITDSSFTVHTRALGQQPTQLPIPILHRTTRSTPGLFNETLDDTAQVASETLRALAQNSSQIGDQPNAITSGSLLTSIGITTDNDSEMLAESFSITDVRFTLTQSTLIRIDFSATVQGPSLAQLGHDDRTAGVNTAFAGVRLQSHSDVGRPSLFIDSLFAMDNGDNQIAGSSIIRLDAGDYEFTAGTWASVIQDQAYRVVDDVVVTELPNPFGPPTQVTENIYGSVPLDLTGPTTFSSSLSFSLTVVPTPATAALFTLAAAASTRRRR